MLSSLTRAARRTRSVKVLLRRGRQLHQNLYQRRSPRHLPSRYPPRLHLPTLVSLRANPHRTRHTKTTESSRPIPTLHPTLLASRRRLRLVSRLHQTKAQVRPRRREANPFTLTLSTTLRTSKSSMTRYAYMTSASAPGVGPVVSAGDIENERTPLLSLFRSPACLTIDWWCIIALFSSRLLSSSSLLSHLSYYFSHFLALYPGHIASTPNSCISTIQFRVISCISPCFHTILSDFQWALGFFHDPPHSRFAIHTFIFMIP